MRYGSLDNRDDYLDLLADPLFAQAFAWLQANPTPKAQEKPYPISSDDAFARVIQYTPEPIEKGRLETHHEYVDLHVCLGLREERIIVADASVLTVIEDIPQRDVTFYATPSNVDEYTSYLMYPGTYFIFDTELDAHMPQRATDVGERQKNLKVVIKLRKSILTPGLKL